ncbi:MAG: GDSL-type esterase/lipase family protein [Dysgonamonadaceae bacterium]|jgi:lysophospholipase L1-like esterase|nr:GDSL-type esterase/lipase family protein [Dysgonamonadaceae bacterium]
MDRRDFFKKTAGVGAAILLVPEIIEMDRRNFFKKTAGAGAATLLIPEIIEAAIPEKVSSGGYQGHSFSKGETILFQGDSITDWRRNKGEENNANTQSQLGSGYVLFTAASILANYANKDLKIYNRGVGGNKVSQLYERWDKDCIDLRPNLLSILIGINDFWHTKSIGYNGTFVTYETDYRKLLERTKKNLPELKIVICEPFFIYGGSALDDTWEADFADYRKVAQTLANDFKLTFVPFQSVFNEALKKAPASYWGEDGIHPSMAGAQLMAQAWLKAAIG